MGFPKVEKRPIIIGIQIRASYIPCSKSNAQGYSTFFLMGNTSVRSELCVLKCKDDLTKVKSKAFDGIRST